MFFTARALCFLFVTSLLAAQCRLPDTAPDALTRLTPDELIDGAHFLRALAALEPLPRDARVEWMTSRAKAALGDLDDALKLAEAAAAADPTNAAYHVQVAAAAGRIAEKSSLFKQLANARKAKKALDDAAELDPGNVQAQWGLMMYYFVAPSLLGGDKAKSEQIGLQMGERGLYYLGRLALEANDAAKAEQYFRQAILENPFSFDTISALANLYIERKPNQALAERWACLAVNTSPLRADAYALLAKTKAMCGCWTEAVAIAERSEAILPDDLAPWFAISQVAIAKHEQLQPATGWLTHYLSKPGNADPEYTSIPAQAALKKLAAELR